MGGRAVFLVLGIDVLGSIEHHDGPYFKLFTAPSSMALHACTSSLHNASILCLAAGEGLLGSHWMAVPSQVIWLKSSIIQCFLPLLVRSSWHACARGIVVARPVTKLVLHNASIVVFLGLSESHVPFSPGSLITLAFRHMGRYEE